MTTERFERDEKGNYIKVEIPKTGGTVTMSSGSDADAVVGALNKCIDDGIKLCEENGIKFLETPPVKVVRAPITTQGPYTYGDYLANGTVTIAEKAKYKRAVVIESTEYDTVNHPKHYNSGSTKCSACGHHIEAIEIVKDFGFCLGNTLKYILRHQFKGKPLEDLKKAAWYLNRAISDAEAVL
jgi:hypothetical protein